MKTKFITFTVVSVLILLIIAFLSGAFFGMLSDLRPDIPAVWVLSGFFVFSGGIVLYVLLDELVSMKRDYYMLCEIIDEYKIYKKEQL